MRLFANHQSIVVGLDGIIILLREIDFYHRSSGYFMANNQRACGGRMH